VNITSLSTGPSHTSTGQFHAGKSRRRQMFQRSRRPQQQGRRMTAVGMREAAAFDIVQREEKRRVRGTRRIFVTAMSLD